MRVRAKHRQAISAQSVDPGKVITGPEKKRALAGPVEVLNLDTGVARIPAPRILQVGIPPGVSESRGKQRLLDGQFYFDAELMARETVALQLVVPDTTLIHVLASESQPPIGGKREFETRLGISDVDNILAVVVDRTNVKFSFLIVDSACPHPSLNRSARVDCHRDKFAVISLFDFVEISESVLDRRDVLGRGWRWDCDLFSIFAQAHAVRRHIGAAAAAVAKLVSTLQNDRLKGIWRHTGVVAVDKRCVVALGSDSNAHVFDDPEFGVKLAQDRIAILPGRQEGGSIPVVRGIYRIGSVKRRSERNMVEKVTGLYSHPSTDGPRLFLCATEVTAVEVERAKVEFELRIFEGLSALFQAPLAPIAKRLIEWRPTLLRR